MIVYAASWDEPGSPSSTPCGREPGVSPAGPAFGTGRIDLEQGRNAHPEFPQVLDGIRAGRNALVDTPVRKRSRDLLEDVGNAAWSPDGGSMAVVRAPQWRYRLEFPAGKVLYETTGWVSHPRVSPKADRIAFLDHPVFGDDRGSVAVMDLSGKKTTLRPAGRASRGSAGRPRATRSGSARRRPAPPAASTPSRCRGASARS